MVKLTALYKHPENKEAFDQHYFEVHVPLANKMPGLLKMEVTKFSHTPIGDPFLYYLQTDLYFQDKDTLDASMKSSEGKEAAKDIWKLAGKITTMIVGEVIEVEQHVKM
jgi:uncharacterized protein (TIGR02118 family)